ncbi:cyclin-dependent kinase 11A-like [Dorcoceras hygrometricum]|uniref:Cyclin-dependent kinase 11A-like n=1 Tax=Dorcoceras hygrometricum TaxID=472368 RepID=A0A2Z7B668_9LAMI|nr:cyclin-dependent kinase 11A-like [Dorcoceras hygrometricum]
MIKRRFYRLEHGDRDAPSDSSSSDSEVEAEATDGTEVEDEEDNKVGELGEKENGTSSSGYESEDSSVNEVNLDSSGLPTSDDDMTTENGEQTIVGSLSRHEGSTNLVNNWDKPEKNDTEVDMADCVLKCKSVFKCRLCPRIVCLSEETLKAHLSSKRHARSLKLQREGRLKLMLNDDGKIEGETELEKDASTTVSGQVSAKPKKKGKGRFKAKKRIRQVKQTLQFLDSNAFSFSFTGSTAIFLQFTGGKRIPENKAGCG